MNFTTDLPKKNPIVSYIVASAVKCEKFFPESAKEGPVFRMHAVILTRRPTKESLRESHTVTHKLTGKTKSDSIASFSDRVSLLDSVTS